MKVAVIIRVIKPNHPVVVAILEPDNCICDNANELFNLQVKAERYVRELRKQFPDFDSESFRIQILDTQC